MDFNWVAALMFIVMVGASLVYVIGVAGVATYLTKEGDELLAVGVTLALLILPIAVLVGFEAA